MANPKELKFAKSHEWVEFISDTQAAVGISNYAQEHLHDIVFVSLPDVGDKVGVGERLCDVESVKAVAEIYSPVEGVISAINEEVQDNPAKINESPYEAWLCKIDEVEKTSGELMSCDEYEAYLVICDAENK